MKVQNPKSTAKAQSLKIYVKGGKFLLLPLVLGFGLWYLGYRRYFMSMPKHHRIIYSIVLILSIISIVLFALAPLFTAQTLK